MPQTESHVTDPTRPTANLRDAELVQTSATTARLAKTYPTANDIDHRKPDCPLASRTYHGKLVPSPAQI